MTTARRTGVLGSMSMLAWLVGLPTPSIAAGPAPTALEAAPLAQPWELAIGLRSSDFHDPGYDPFSDNDSFGQLTVGLMRSFDLGQRFRPALGVNLETGGAGAEARAAQAHLSLLRVALALEGRYQIRSAWYVFGRVAPGILRGEVSLADDSAPATLGTTFGKITVDGSAGASVRLASLARWASLWLTGEGGYGWADRQALVLTPRLAAADRTKAGATALGTLAARGPFLRLQVAVSFY